MKASYLIIPLFLVVLSCKTSKKSLEFKNEKPTIFEQFSYKTTNKPQISVHRGGGNSVGWPENCLESFKDISSKIPCLIECDIEMSQDSIMVLMHDRTLDRTTNATGGVYNRKFADLGNVKLKDNFGNLTNYTIPELEKTLIWGKGKVVFTLDVKKTTPYKKVIEMVNKLNVRNNVIIITYNLNQAVEVYNLDKNVLISATIMQELDYERLAQAGIPDKNLIAFIGTREPKPELISFLHKKGIMTILGVLGNLDKKAAAKGDQLYVDWLKTGVDIFATDRPESVYEAIAK